MRIVDVEDLCGGEIIGRDVICSNGTILLKSQTKYRPSFKEKLLELNVPFVYIDDVLSAGIEPQTLISNEKKSRFIKDFTVHIDQLKSQTFLKVEPIYNLAMDLIDEVSSQDIMYDILDIKRNDIDVYEHSLGVAIIALILCKKMNLKHELMRDILIGALLHDIGKILIPKEILNKVSQLDEKEHETIKQHPVLGYNILKDDPQISAVTKLIVLCHHEREDGSGYPLGKGEDLHIGAKIIACCDAFNALTSSRPYRQGMELNEVVILLRREKLNVEVRTTLESILAFYPIGTTVLLSNGTVGIVEKNYQGNLKRPLVRIVKDGNTLLQSPYRVDLSKEQKLFIANRISHIS